MTYPLVFLIDVDNTLLDHDRLKENVGALVDRLAPGAGSAVFWRIYEEVRRQTDIADFMETARRYGAISRDPGLGWAIQRALKSFPFAALLYPDTLTALAELAGLGLLVVLCDGDDAFQRHKLRMTGIDLLIEGRILVYAHKEQNTADIERRYPAAHYVMIDDKPRIHRAMRAAWGDRVTTVLVRQGHYGRSDPRASTKAADIEVECLAEVFPAIAQEPAVLHLQHLKLPGSSTAAAAG